MSNSSITTPHACKHYRCYLLVNQCRCGRRPHRVHAPSVCLMKLAHMPSLGVVVVFRGVVIVGSSSEQIRDRWVDIRDVRCGRAAE